MQMPDINPAKVADLDDFEAQEALAMIETALTIPDLELESLYRMLAGKYPRRRDPLGRGTVNVIDLRDRMAIKARRAIRERLDANRSRYHVARSVRSILRRRFKLKDPQVSAGSSLR